MATVSELVEQLAENKQAVEGAKTSLQAAIDIEVATTIALNEARIAEWEAAQEE